MALVGIDLFAKNRLSPGHTGYVLEILKYAGGKHLPAIAIGNRCLAARPEAAREAEANFNTLRRRFPPLKGHLERDQETFARALRARINEDFVDGNISHLDGWILSRSEQLYCTTLAWADLKFSRHVARHVG